MKKKVKFNNFDNVSFLKYTTECMNVTVNTIMRRCFFWCIESGCLDTRTGIFKAMPGVNSKYDKGHKKYIVYRQKLDEATNSYCHRDPTMSQDRSSSLLHNSDA